MEVQAERTLCRWVTEEEMAGENFEESEGAKNGRSPCGGVVVFDDNNFRSVLIYSIRNNNGELAVISITYS
jgi:hypothetical protein